MAAKNIEKRKRVMQRSIKLGHCICDPRLACPCELFKQKNVCLCAGERLEVQPGPTRLTQLVEKTGCASKIDQGTLRRVLGGIPLPADPRVIIGAPAGDDAGVFRAGDGQAWVQTVDVFSPSVDDPYLFGQIAAANSVSDVYAMGGVPMTALSIIGFPARELPDAIMSEIIRGGVDKMAEAGVSIIGGHSINDHEIKAGFAVTGLIDPDRILSNAAARPGDVLVLTKPLGTGIISFAAQIDRVPTVSTDFRATGGSPASTPGSSTTGGLSASTPRIDPVEAIGRSMSTLNKTAAEWMVRLDAHACTDITGFGMIGHVSAMAAAGAIDVEIVWDDVPVFDGVLESVAVGIVPGAIERNRESSQEAVVTGEGVTPGMLDILFDAQTSGGLLIALPQKQAEELVRRLHAEGITAAAIVGRVMGAGSGRVHVRTTGRRPAPETLAETVPPVARPLPAASDRKPESAVQGAVDADDGCCCDDGHGGPAPVGSAMATSSTPLNSAGSSDVQQRFHDFLKAANRPGALDAHTKQAISIALSVLAKCEPCIRSHVAKAQQGGFTREEIDDAAWMAISFGGAPLMMFYNDVRRSLS